MMRMRVKLGSISLKRLYPYKNKKKGGYY